MRTTDKYAEYVDHPRYGKSPRVTGLNPQTDYGGDVFIHWHSPKDCRIPDTAIVADTSRQKAPTVAVTHYYDVKRRCRDCDRMFIFFADEQRHWYEVLGFGLDSDCVRCIDCRKSDQQTARLRERYESLLSQPDRTDKTTLELIDCALTLIEQSVFGHRSLERVRALLNSFPSDLRIRRHATYRNLSLRADTLTEESANNPMHGSGEVVRFQMDIQSSPPRDR